MSDRCFTLTARESERGVRITAAASPDCWPSLHARLLIAGAEAVSLPSLAHGVMAATFSFPDVSASGPVCPEGYELDAFMRRLFVGFNAGAVNG